jgi:hypothetical protein
MEAAVQAAVTMRLDLVAVDRYKRGPCQLATLSLRSGRRHIVFADNPKLVDEHRDLHDAQWRLARVNHRQAQHPCTRESSHLSG